MKDRCKVAILIINYNGNDDTLQCLRSVDMYCKMHDYNVFLVDNASANPLEDNDLMAFKTNISYIKSPKNLGFAGGNNFALSYLGGKTKFDYLFLLNNDTVLVDDSVDRLIAKLEETELSIGGIVNYYYDKPNIVWQAGSFIRPALLSSKEAEFDKSSETLVCVDAIPGSSMMIKLDVVEKLGLFDDRYFAYYEEIDFCVKAKKEGFKVAFLPNTKLLHKVGRASPSRLKHYLRSRNTLLFYSLHFRKFMLVGYSRVFIRTIRDIIKSKFQTDYLSPMIRGVSDYRKGNFKEGDISAFK